MGGHNIVLGHKTETQSTAGRCNILFCDENRILLLIINNADKIMIVLLVKSRDDMAKDKASLLPGEAANQIKSNQMDFTLLFW